MVKERAISAPSIGFLTIASIFILFVVLIASGGLYFYKGIVTKNISKMENDLSLARSRFEPSRLAELQILDKRLQASSEILGKHISITPVFRSLEMLTMKTVRFTKFSYDLGDEKNLLTETGSKVVIKMSGLAVGYRSIALQSDLLAKEKNFIDPVFSNLVLDEKGNVLFDLEFSVDPSFVDYKQMLLTTEAPQS